jgi:hypothetical protein
MANKRDIREIKACVKELEERIFNEYKYAVIFENLCEVIDDVFSTIYEAVDRTNSIEYLDFVRMYFNYLLQEVSIFYKMEMNCKFFSLGI